MKGDPRLGFMGHHTGCCQHLDQGAGQRCAEHSIYSPDGIVWVIERFGSILAQAWVWRRDTVLCLDNIEANRVANSEHEPVVRDLFIRACHSVVGRLGIEHVYLGTGQSEMEFDEFPLDRLFGQYHHPEGYSGYSDAQSAWKII